MLSIFPRLLSLKKSLNKNPEEDFLTEIFAFVLENDESILKLFLSKNKIIDSNDEFKINKIKPQDYFQKENKDDDTSIIDLAIYLKNQTIFIENKVNSSANINQIEKYGKLLDRRMSNKKTLIYITKNFEDISKQKEALSKDILFKHIRWYEILDFLKNIENKSKITDQLIKHLEFMGIQSDIRFNSLDISTMQNMQRLMKMMENVIYGKVINLFLKEMEQTKAQQVKPEIQIRDSNRYVYFHKGKGCHIVFGFILNSTNECDFPRVGFQIWRDPDSQENQMITDLMVETKWDSYNLDNSREWACVFVEKNILEFMNNENHVEQIEKYLVESIQKFKSVKNSFMKYL